MQDNQYKISILIVVTILLSIFSIVVSDSTLRLILWTIYLVQYSIITKYTFELKDRWLSLLSPSFITVTYLSISNILGAYAFENRIVNIQDDYFAYSNWVHLNWVVVFILICNVAVMLPLFMATPKLCFPINDIKNTIRANTFEVILVLIFCLSIILIFSYVNLDLSLIGGFGNFAIFPKTIAALAIILTLTKNKVRWRFFYYILLIFYFASFSSEDKREAVFLIMPIILLESLYFKPLRIKLKLIASVLFITTFLTTLIIMMSIYRGYGGFEPDSFFDARNYIIEYIKDENFAAYFLNNLEINYSFFHLHQSIEYVLDSPDLLLYGSTFIKVLLIPVPRYLYPEKPASIIDHYTAIHSQSYRDLGGSWVSTIYSEYAWNFHFLGILGLFITYMIANRFFFVITNQIRNKIRYKHIIGLYAYQTMLELIRGCGFDQYFTYVIIATFIALFGFLPPLLLISRISAREKA